MYEDIGEWVDDKWGSDEVDIMCIIVLYLCYVVFTFHELLFFNIFQIFHFVCWNFFNFFEKKIVSNEILLENKTAFERNERNERVRRLFYIFPDALWQIMSKSLTNAQTQETFIYP